MAFREHARECRAAEHETPCTTLLPLVHAALLPLVRHEADVVQVVLKHYQWAVLVDRCAIWSSSTSR